MAIYRDGENFYVNGLAGTAGNETAKLRGHLFSRSGFQMLSRIYSVLLLLQILITPLVIWFGPVQKTVHQALHMNWVSLLSIVICFPVLVVLLTTLLLRKELATFHLTSVDIEKTQSSRYYAFYALSSINLLILLASAPWGPGWYIPVDVLAPAALIFLLFVGSVCRLFQVRRSDQV